MKFDFSKLALIEPKEDSWEKVCKRLDKEAKKVKCFRILPFAACLVGTALLLMLFQQSYQKVSINNLIGEEISDWYYSLGNDDLDFIDENFSYLIKE